MGLIEIEIAEDRAVELVKLLLSAAPLIPLPTLAALGPDRLISGWSWDWKSVSFQDASMGFLEATATATVHHASLPELDADPATDGQVAEATVALHVSAQPGRLTIDAVRIDVDGAASQLLSPPVTVGMQPLPSMGAASSQLDHGAILLDSQVVTIRLGTAGVDRFDLPAANRILASGDEWAIRISGEAFAEVVLAQLAEVAANPGPGVSVEDPPGAGWDGSRVVASIGLKKTDACNGLFGLFPTDLSVTVEVILALDPDAVNQRLGLTLGLSTSASDWDSFRCWLGGPVLVGLIPVFGIGLALITLIEVGRATARGASEALAGHDPGGGFVRSGGDDSSPLYYADTALPTFGPLAEPNPSTTVGADGLVVSGRFGLIPVADHKVAFDPADHVGGKWVAEYDCRSHQWHDTYMADMVSINDEIDIIGKFFRWAPVTVFPATHATPQGAWAATAGPGFDGSGLVKVDAIPGPIPVAGVLYVHSSAGLRRYVIDAVPPVPEPTPFQTAVADLQCQKFGREWNRKVQIGWLVDPPIDGLDPSLLRQWQIVIAEVAEDSTWSLVARQNGEERGEVASVTAWRAGSLGLEIVTDQATELALHHARDEAPRMRIRQRWLIPTRVVDLPSAAITIGRDGSIVTVRTANALIVVRPADESVVTIAQQENAAEVAAPPPSLTLPDRTVVATWGDKLVFARAAGETSLITGGRLTRQEAMD